MSSWQRVIVLVALCQALVGCSIFDVRDARFEQRAQAPFDTLVLIGGNSECGGDKGLWKIRSNIRDDLALRLGSRRNLTTVYFSWTGDDPKGGTCLPDRLFDYQHGEIRILEELRSRGYLGGGRLIVVGWSNGGKTADEFARRLHQALAPMRVDLLVTLDPVSRLTRGPVVSEANDWFNVYVQSVGWQRFSNLGNIIAWIGGAWNEEVAALPRDTTRLNRCIAGNHGDVLSMWDAVLTSPEFAEWSKEANPAFRVEHARQSALWRDPEQPLPCRSGR